VLTTVLYKVEKTKHKKDNDSIKQRRTKQRRIFYTRAFNRGYCHRQQRTWILCRRRNFLFRQQENEGSSQSKGNNFKLALDGRNTPRVGETLNRILFAWGKP
jgi:hypothetical protein